ncbi:hypothetical protein NX819_14710 [Bacillus subtilis]|uniref:hypothetical protein n=1 Tax=Bacillus subtilis TaxID=1423 RepID=UPI000C766C9B|nr:hypothetical protein [Bacillus subtilis]PLV34947.1 hypothetical protein BSP4_10630 [Bacillus subtilis subsp. subtilis]UVW20649.1 hypothetical protein NX819_14710 [Bacillus subtilis]
MTLSKWTDTTGNNMEDILSNIMNYNDWFEPEKDPLTKENLNYNIEKIFEENKEIVLNNTVITYNFLRFEYERVRAGEVDNPMRSIRIYSLTGNVIIYTDGTQTQYIINRSGGPHTLTLLRKLNNYNRKKEITYTPFHVSEDIFIWMIYKVLTGKEESLQDDCRLIMKKIIGFKGATKDRLAEVKGTGKKILNLLSTLAFLFENENVSNINLQIEYKNETIETLMDLSGTLDIDLDKYLGQYFMDHEYERNAKVILTTFLEIIPKIITVYHLDIENGEWSVDKKIEFFDSIGTQIRNKINDKIKKMSKDKK